jgi:hypothetical protein
LKHRFSVQLRRFTEDRGPDHPASAMISSYLEVEAPPKIVSTILDLPDQIQSR